MDTNLVIWIKINQTYKLKKLPSIYWLNLDSEDQRKIYMGAI